MVEFAAFLVILVLLPVAFRIVWDTIVGLVGGFMLERMKMKDPAFAKKFEEKYGK